MQVGLVCNCIMKFLKVKQLNKAWLSVKRFQVKDNKTIQIALIT